MKLRRGDLVQVMAGKDIGTQAKIARVMPKTRQVIVEGVNTAKRHQKPQGQTMQGGIIDKDMPIDASNVMIVCSSCSEPTRVGYRFNDEGEKIRTCRKCEGDV